VLWNGVTSVNGIFDNGYAGGMGMENTNPTLTFRDADISGIKQKDTLALRGKTYKVRELIPDGLGITVVDLTLNG
jgi:hypothetical protein